MNAASGRLRPEDLRFDPPAVSTAAIAALASRQYEITGTLTPLRGERDLNTLITCPDGARFVLKVASPSEAFAGAEFQCGALRHIAAVDPELGVPRVVPTLDGEPVTTLDIDGAPAAVRVLTFLPGTTFDDADGLPDAGLRAIGAFQGRLARALSAYEHPAAANFMAWDLAAGLVSNDELWAGLSPAAAAVAEPCRPRVERATESMNALRRQIVHNDGHRGNLLRSDTSSTKVTGVIDFGDLVHTALVNDLAICAASFVAGQADQPGALCALAAGYDASMPLLDDELDLLVDLVLSRMVLSTLLVEFQAQHTPHIAVAVAAELPGLLTTVTAWSALDAERLTAAVRSHVLAGGGR